MVSRCSITKLTVRVVTPCPQTAIRFDCNGVCSPGRYGWCQGTTAINRKGGAGPCGRCRVASLISSAPRSQRYPKSAVSADIVDRNGFVQSGSSYHHLATRGTGTVESDHPWV